MFFTSSEVKQLLTFVEVNMSEAVHVMPISCRERLKKH